MLLVHRDWLALGRTEFDCLLLAITLEGQEISASALEYVPPNEFEADYLKRQCMDGMGFLESFHTNGCQSGCQSKD